MAGFGVVNGPEQHTTYFLSVIFYVMWQSSNQIFQSFWVTNRN